MEIDEALRATIADAVREALATVPISRTMIAEVVRDELKNHGDFCRIDVSDETLKEVGHAFGVFADLGGGNANLGIEAVRDNHKWVKSMRGLSNKIGGIILVVVLTAMAGGVVTAFWAGFKELAKLGK